MTTFNLKKMVSERQRAFSNNQEEVAWGDCWQTTFALRRAQSSVNVLIISHRNETDVQEVL